MRQTLYLSWPPSSHTHRTPWTPHLTVAVASTANRHAVHFPPQFRGHHTDSGDGFRGHHVSLLTSRRRGKGQRCIVRCYSAKCRLRRSPDGSGRRPEASPPRRAGHQSRLVVSGDVAMDRSEATPDFDPSVRVGWGRGVGDPKRPRPQSTSDPRQSTLAGQAPGSAGTPWPDGCHGLTAGRPLQATGRPLQSTSTPRNSAFHPPKSTSFPPRSTN
jgi:hypothetical protein